MSFFGRTLLKTAKWGAVTSSACIGVASGYVYLTFPEIIPNNLYQNFKPDTCRKQALGRLKNDVFDLVVVGGGATGASVALDGASRGLKVALIERNDFSSGTSSRSTKLLHGGVRYLQQFVSTLDLGLLQLVYDALRERAHMLRSSPYMTQPLAILMPIYSPLNLGKMWAGLKLYEFCGLVSTMFATGLPNSYWTSRKNCVHKFPLLISNGLLGGIMYYDGQQNDSRVCLTIALTSSVKDYIPGWVAATIINHTNVLRVSKNTKGECDGVFAKDELTKEEFKVSGKVVVNATGPFCDELRLITNSEASKVVVPAAGAHLVMPKSYSSPACGILIPETTDGRVLFYLPWEGNTLVGTTDVKSEITKLPKPTADELEFIVKESAKYLTLSEDDVRSDVTAAWSGIRPLVLSSKKGETSELSRDHEVLVDEPSGLVSIVGGKWTTCRLMAEETVNKALEFHSSKIRAKKPCRTFGLQLIGSQCDERKYLCTERSDYTVLANRLGMVISREYGLDLDDAVHLAKNYGTRAFALCELGQKTDTLSPILPRQSFLKTELFWACQNEMAETVVDIIAYRTRMAFVDPESTLAVLPEVVEMIGNIKGWDAQRKKSENREAREFLATMTYNFAKGGSRFVRRKTYKNVSNKACQQESGK